MTRAPRPATHRQPLRRQLAITLAAAFAQGPALLPAALPALAGVAIAALLPTAAQAETMVKTFAGDGRMKRIDGTGTAASIILPRGMVFDSNGNMFVASTDSIRKITPAGVVTTFAGGQNSTDENRGYADGTGAAALFNNACGLAIDRNDNLYVADSSNNLIRKITPAGVVTTIAGGGSPGNTTQGYADGTGTDAKFMNPLGIAIDSNDNLYVADSNNQVIRKITPAGVVTTLAGSHLSMSYADGTGSAARFMNPTSLAVDSSDNLYVADSSNNLIRKITPAGVVTTVAGGGSAGGTTSGFADGTGVAAKFKRPSGLTFDSSGNLYVADSDNDLIRKVTPAGVVTTIAGSGSRGYMDGIVTQATFRMPGGLAFDSSEELYVADTYNQRIRKLTSAPGLSASVPADNATDVLPGATIALSFSAPMTLDTTSAAATRLIRIVNDTEETVEEIDIASPANGQLVFSNNNQTLTITPATPLASGNSYHLEIGSTALKDGASKPYPGIADTTTFNFDVASVAATPSISSTESGDGSVTLTFATPSDGGAALSGYVLTVTPSGGSPLTITLPAAGAGSTASTGGVTATVSSVSNGNTVITLSGLSNGTTYAATVAAKNVVGNSAPSSSPQGGLTPTGQLTATPAFTNAGSATLTLQSRTTGTGYLTLLEGANASCGTPTQTQAGQDSQGNPAYRSGSLPLTAATPASYTLRNLIAASNYTACIVASDGSTLPSTVLSSQLTTGAQVDHLLPTWATVGTAGFSAGEAKNTKLAFAPDGTPYVAYIDAGNANKATVMKYVAGAWTAVGIPGFSSARINYPSLAFSPDGTPYLAYWDSNSNNGGKTATVMKFTNGAWNVVGNAFFSAGLASYVSLAFAPDGTPYLGYQDSASNGFKATVMKFNGSNWVAVGSPGLSAGQAYDTSLAISADGTPYIAYRDNTGSNANYGKATVMKFANGSWSTVGSQFFTAGRSFANHLAIAPDGSPYLAYWDGDQDSKAVVMKFTNGAWSTVGGASISLDYVDAPSLAFAPDGSPSLAFVDGSKDGKATLMKFSNGSWSVFSNAGFSPDAVDYTSLAYAPDGTAYVAYQDSNNGNKASVMKIVPGIAVTATPGNQSAALSFATPANNGSALTGYVLTITPANGTPVTLTLAGLSTTTTSTAGGLTATISSVSGGNTVISVAGLTNGTAYSANISARNAGGNAAASTWPIVSVTPQAPTQPNTPDTPTTQPSNPFNPAGTSTGNEVKDFPTGSGSGYVPATSSLVTNLPNLENKVGVSDNGVVVITSTTKEPVRIKSDAPDNVLFSVPVNNSVAINIGGKGINVVTNTDPVKDSSGKAVSTVLATKTLTNEQGQSVQSVQVVKGQAEVKSTEANQIVGGLTLSKDATLRDVTATAGAIGSTVGFYKNPADFSGSVSAESGDAVVHVTLSGSANGGKAGDHFANATASTRTLTLKAGEVARFDKMGELIGVFAGSLSGTVGKTGDALVTTPPAGIAGYPQAIAKLDGKTLDRLGNNLLPAFLAAVMPQGSVKSAATGRAAAAADASFSLAQNASSGVVKLTFYGRDYYGLPLMPVPVDASVADGGVTLADGTVVWTEQGVSVRFAPAIADLPGFAKTAQTAGISTQIGDDGTVKLSTAGTVFYARPRFAADAVNGTAGFAVNPPYAITYTGVDGLTYMYGPSIDRATFTGSDGKSQIFDPTLYDATQITTLVQAAGSDWQQSRSVDGGLVLRHVSGQSFTLLPDYAVTVDTASGTTAGSTATPPAAAPAAWSAANGRIIVRYRTGFIPMIQSFSVK